MKENAVFRKVEKKFIKHLAEKSDKKHFSVYVGASLNAPKHTTNVFGNIVY